LLIQKNIRLAKISKKAVLWFRKNLFQKSFYECERKKKAYK